ncbi:NADP-dependent oxidoreductase domain-containing protein [Neohortaea acidophila]|uniref:NADP-dependent oxidoreductase domain-containing protein n=1 Tax=Neohortaea acidophila TaxID=245834 RepID=A0A6A6PLK3_9PEZI|nr:NADP-dependent oxidoreductase domain-containing protein [Neohortaea acidophila]KAF2480353.1 NADP-dependent oxidoreductase domain-containing protein [Neohortaea acidophila]
MAGSLRAGATGPDDLPEIFNLLEKYRYTAALYGDSEEYLGKVDAGKRFVLDTKTRGDFGGPVHATRQTVVAEGKQSRELLGSGVDVFYLHAPDTAMPIEETLAGVNEVYKTGFFKRFGLSNYAAEYVEKIYGICKEKGYLLPSVYQGMYEPVARKQETVLFPTLRKLGMSFFAYSAMAGGFLSKSKQEVLDG